jgi:hypothetical protein
MAFGKGQSKTAPEIKGFHAIGKAVSKVALSIRHL